MNNPTSDQIYWNLASRVLTLLLEREHAKNAATDSETSIDKGENDEKHTEDTKE